MPVRYKNVVSHALPHGAQRINLAAVLRLPAYLVTFALLVDVDRQRENFSIAISVFKIYPILTSLL